MFHLPSNIFAVLSISHQSLISISNLNQAFSHQWSSSHHGNPKTQSSGGPQWGVSFFSQFPFSICLSLQFQYGLALFLTLCYLPKHRQDNFTLFLHTSFPTWPCISIPLPLTVLSPLCVELFVPLPVNKQSYKGGEKLAVPPLV